MLPMPSVALHRWTTTARAALDQLVAAHNAVGGPGRGRRYATLQVNHAYAVLLSSQFQGFCRDLHSEAVDFLASNTAPPSLQIVVRALPYAVSAAGKPSLAGAEGAFSLSHVPGLALIGLVLLVAAGTAWWWFNRPPPPPHRPAASWPWPT